MDEKEIIRRKLDLVQDKIRAFKAMNWPIPPTVESRFKNLTLRYAELKSEEIK
jgi:hypothetical protein